MELGLLHCFALFFAENFPPGVYEELLVNCLGTLNNLTYYSDGSNYIMENLEEVTGCKFLCCLLQGFCSWIFKDYMCWK